MKALTKLEEKIAALVNAIQRLKADNAVLVEENARLTEKLELVESSIMTSTERIELLDQEKARTKMVVDDLIKNIDSLVKSEDQR